MVEENTQETPEVKTKTERVDFLKEAREIADRTEKAVAEMRELTARNEEIKAFNVLSGKSDVGTEEKPKEETPEEYANKLVGA